MWKYCTKMTRSRVYRINLVKLDRSYRIGIGLRNRTDGRIEIAGKERKKRDKTIFQRRLENEFKKKNQSNFSIFFS